MYKFHRDQVLEPEFLTKLVERFKKEYVPRFIRDQKYYEVETEILKRTMTDGKPNNRLAHGFCRYITNMATSYFAGKPLGYIVEDNEYQEALRNLFSEKLYRQPEFCSIQGSRKKGIGFLLMFLNENGDLRIKKMDAETIIPVYSASLDEFLEAAVHIWADYDIDNTLLCEYADVYDDTFLSPIIQAGKWCTKLYAAAGEPEGSAPDGGHPGDRVLEQ